MARFFCDPASLPRPPHGVGRPDDLSTALELFFFQLGVPRWSQRQTAPKRQGQTSLATRKRARDHLIFAQSTVRCSTSWAIAGWHEGSLPGLKSSHILDCGLVLVQAHFSKETHVTENHATRPKQPVLRGGGMPLDQETKARGTASRVLAVIGWTGHSRPPAWAASFGCSGKWIKKTV